MLNKEVEIGDLKQPILLTPKWQESLLIVSTISSDEHLNQTLKKDSASFTAGV